jgi:hypothetical protein
MLRAGGYAEIIGGSGTLAAFEPRKRFLVTSDHFEIDTWACVHCNAQVHAPTRAKDTEYFFCQKCMKRICPSCADHPCFPWLKKLEIAERRDRALRSYGV